MSEQQIFTAELNPLDENQMVIYESSCGLRHYRFAVDMANFDDEHDFEDFIKYVLESLNKPLITNK